MGSLITVSRELSKCKLDLIAMHKVRWEDIGTQLAGECTSFLTERGMRIMN
jgi:hypothetical protein